MPGHWEVPWFGDRTLDFIPFEERSTRLDFRCLSDEMVMLASSSDGEEFDQTFLVRTHRPKVLAQFVPQTIKGGLRFTLEHDGLRKDSVRARVEFTVFFPESGPRTTDFPP